MSRSPALDTDTNSQAKSYGRRLFLAAAFRIRPQAFQALCERADAVRRSSQRRSFLAHESWAETWAREHRLLFGERTLKTNWLFTWSHGAVSWLVTHRRSTVERETRTGRAACGDFGVC